VRQDESMPCFLIPPTVEQQISLLDTSVIPNYPLSFTNNEYLNCTPAQLIGDDSSNKNFSQPAPIEGN